MPGWLATYRRLHPGAEVGLRVRNSDRVFDEVLSGACDIGFVETPLSRKNLHGTVVADEGVTVQGLVPPGHKLAVRAIRAGQPVRRYGQVIGHAEFGTEVWISHEGRAIGIGRYMGGEVHPSRVFVRP